jgi:DNA polymerase phi
VYNGDPDAIELLDELEGCYNELRKRTRSGGVEDMAASETLVEILLSFLSKPSKLFARMSEQVFESLSDQMTPGSLEILLNVRLQKQVSCGVVS